MFFNSCLIFICDLAQKIMQNKPYIIYEAECSEITPSQVTQAEMTQGRVDSGADLTSGRVDLLDSRVLRGTWLQNTSCIVWDNP